MKKYFLSGAALLTLAACANDAEVASSNLSTEADNFHVNRRIVFYNGITDQYILTITGLCSIQKGDSIPKEVAVVCKTGPQRVQEALPRRVGQRYILRRAD